MALAASIAPVKLLQAFTPFVGAKGSTWINWYQLQSQVQAQLSAKESKDGKCLISGVVWG